MYTKDEIINDLIQMHLALGQYPPSKSSLKQNKKAVLLQWVKMLQKLHFNPS